MNKIKKNKFLFTSFIIISCFIIANCGTHENKLCQIIESGNYKKIEDYLEKYSPDLNQDTLNDKGKTTIHAAVETGNIDIVRLLIKYDYKLTHKDKNGRYPLDYADHPLLKKYIRNTINDRFSGACYDNDLKRIKELYAAGGSLDYNSYDYGQPLHNAITGGQLEVLNFLVNKGADINKRGINKGTILHTALLSEEENKNTYEIVSYIISLSFDVNLKDWNEQTPIFHSTNPRITNLLIKHGAKVTIRDYTGSTPLHAIMKDSGVESAKVLIKNGAHINAKDNDGNTPLHYCGSDNCKDGTMMRYMLSAGANVHAKNKYLLTPLHIAAAGMFGDGHIHRECLNSHINEKSVELLIMAGSNVNAMDFKKRTPLHFAAEAGSLKSCMLLVKHGAKVNIKMKGGATALDLAKKYKNKDIVNSKILNMGKVN
ncbi:MAG: hypothetical protein GY754_29165 [bacterium]|nr:hypothetical protein [bacterium]